MLIRTIATLAAEHSLPIKLLVVGLNRDARAELLESLTPDERRILTPARTYLAQRRIAWFYRASDAFVMNSQAPETFGRVTIEAMANGLPVAATTAGGAAEIIDDGITGFLYPTGEAGQTLLAERVQSLVVDRPLGWRLGNAGRDAVRSRFRQDAFLSQLADAINQAGIN